MDSLVTSPLKTKIDPAKLPMCNGAVTLNENSVSAGVLRKKDKLLDNPNLWHKIIVRNGCNYTKEFVLKTILNNIHPLDFIPVKYHEKSGNAMFFVRNCKEAIQKLVNQNLLVMNPQNKNEPLKLTVILAYTNTTEFIVNVQDNILSVLNKRYNISSKTLNLEFFYRDPDLSEFCTLSQPKILYFVLYLCKQFHIQTLKLSNNEINILSPIESIWGMKGLTTLELRNNSIDNIRELDILKSMPITELSLDGNPLCGFYDDYSYMQAIKEVCPNIEKLDGVLLGQNGFLAFRRNFLCNMEGQELIDQFLHHYFTLYDSPDRSILEGLYHRNAMFSLTCRYLARQNSSSTANLTRYMSLQRNLKSLSDLAKSEENLVQGNQNIIKILCYLSPSEHDPYTFTVDMVHYSEHAVVLTITGVFREITKSLLDAERILGFSRTFVLKKTINNEYNILNEQLCISNAATIQQQLAFKVVRVAKNYISHLPIAETENQKTEMVEALMLLTNMTDEWSRKCLTECHYDFQKTLDLFVKLYKADNIPTEAFPIEIVE